MVWELLPRWARANRAREGPMVHARRFLLTALSCGVAGTLALIGASRADLVPGGGPTKSDCYAGLSVLGAANPGSTGNQVKNNKVVECTDGEACDQGACGDNA